MKSIWVCLFFLIGCVMINSQEKKAIIAEGAKVEKLAEGFSFTEGPAVDNEGNVFFTDQPNNRIFKWSIDGKLSIFHEKAGRANGLYFDRDGALLSCSDMDNEIWKIRMNGDHSVLVAGFDGKKLNGPNDLWLHPDGGIYFTDPLYERNYWTRDPKMQQEGQHVYFLSSDRKSIVPVATDLEKPNGIIGSPDGELVYVADIKANKTYAYTVREDGALVNKRLFAPLGSDGMTMDEEGNVYLTGNGITVFSREGQQIEHIPVDANWTANVCFGGKDMNFLFITASQYIYGLRMNVKGVR